MEATGIQSYAVNLQSFEFNFFQGQTIKKAGNFGVEVREADFAVRYAEFRLDIQIRAEPQFSDQGGIQQFFANKDFDFSQLQHNGKRILDLQPEEAAKLISEDGFWGVNQTAGRLAGFVLTGAGDDLDRLQAGRAGIIRGFNEAEKIWGETLPEISYETLENSLSQIDERIRELGGSVVDIEA